MATLYTQQDKNIRKTWLLMTGFLVFVITVVWIFAQVYQAPGILYFGIIFAIAMNFFSYWYSDKIVLGMAGAHPIDEKSHPDIYHLMENLAITSGLPMPRLYLIIDPAPNAFATGRNPENAAVAVTTGLIERLEKSELEGVLAHELSHVGNRDILISTVIVILVGFLALISDLFFRMNFLGGRDDRESSKSAGIFMLIAIVLALLSPIIGVIIQLAISRKREFLADASGALLTRYPDGLASALEKISNYPASMIRANHATAHLYIASPFKGKESVSFFTKLFMTHPPITERVKALRSAEY